MFNPVQKRIGLMPAATVGALLSAAGYFGYSMVGLGYVDSLGYGWFSGSMPRGFLWYCFAMAVGGVGSTFTGGSIAPFLSTLASKNNLGRVMSVPSLASSAGRMAGPPLFGWLYVSNVRQPYVAASIACAVASGTFLLVLAFHSTARQAPESPLSKFDSANRPTRTKLDRAQEDIMAAIQAELRDILLDRGYSLSSAESRMYIVAILENAFPQMAETEDELELLGREVHRQHAHAMEDHHAHHA